MADLYIGLMSGTSIDAIDAVLVDLSTQPPLVLESHSHKIPQEIRQSILSLCQPGENEIDRMGQLDMLLGNLFAGAVRNLLSRVDDNITVTAIGSHGQTIRHRPELENPFTLQVANPAVIALQTGITTVADFRTADMAAAGQGAPLAPAFHEYAFRDSGVNRVVLNLGGIANITVLPADPAIPTSGFDTGPANILMDSWMQAYFNEAYDKDGELASQGNVIEELLTCLLEDPYFSQQPPKTTGREYFNLDWLSDYLDRLDKPFEPVDVLATLNRLTVRTVGDAIKAFAPGTTELLVCGGGAKNTMLLNGLSNELGSCEVNITQKYGIDPDWIEGVAFAWLAKQCLAGETGNLPTVTGAKHKVILGGIYPAPPK